MLAVVLAVALSPDGAQGELPLDPAFPATPLRGAKDAPGAVIWNHGVNFLYGAEGAASPVPPLMQPFRDAGWDVFRLTRPRISEEPRRSRDEVGAAVERLHAEGYARVVLAGQSGGAWLSLMAARGDGVDAVIANAPAWYGTDHPTYMKNAAALFDYLDDIRHARVMISFFNGDPYDPGGRGERSEAILAKHGVPHLIIDRPDGLAGHSAGDSGLFLRRFGACALAVAGAGPMPTRADCVRDFGNLPSPALRLPARLAVAAASGGPADPFLGKWYGVYANGRELMLVVERAAGDRVEAVYAYGAGPLPTWNAGYSHRDGRIAGDALLFEEEGKSTLRFRVVEGRLQAQWVAVDGKTTLQTMLHLVP